MYEIFSPELWEDVCWHSPGARGGGEAGPGPPHLYHWHQGLQAPGRGHGHCGERRDHHPEGAQPLSGHRQGAQERGECFYITR